MKRVLVLISLATAACGVPQADVARLMKQEGITNWTDGGIAVFGCGSDDSFSEKFSGVKNGIAVSGIVCGGWTKGYTVRYK